MKVKGNNNNNNNSGLPLLLFICNVAVLLFFNFTSLWSHANYDDLNDYVASPSSSSSSSSSSASLSLFDEAAQYLFDIATDSSTFNSGRKEFPTDVNEWKKMKLTTLGGLTDNDRTTLGKIYSEADSIFEYGLGESTSIAAYVGVPRYSGVDSDPEYVSYARTLAPNYFRFYFADIGPTIEWGFPKYEKLSKNKFNYQVSSLLSENNKPFDVYMVDGRYRLPCVLISLLHASSSSGSSSTTNNNNNNNGPIVLLHDCFVQNSQEYSDRAANHEHRKHYQYLNTILDQVDNNADTLCVYQRKPTTTDQMIYDMWMQYQDKMI
jgi:hypothetical protein